MRWYHLETPGCYAKKGDHGVWLVIRGLRLKRPVSAALCRSLFTLGQPTDDETAKRLESIEPGTWSSLVAGTIGTNSPR